MSDEIGTKAPIPEVGIWAREKLERLRRYLDAFTKALGGANKGRDERGLAPFRTIYIDAFAGAGIARVVKGSESAAEGAFMELTAERREDAGERGLLAGSPRVALEIPTPFGYYRFVERDPDRLFHLRALKAEHSDRKIEIIEEDCNDWLHRDVLTAGDDFWRGTRGVAFLDPFGMQVPWATIEGIARRTELEVILNFPMYMGTQRLVKRSATFSPAERAKLDAWFGDPGWYAVAFDDRPGLFGQVTTKVAGSSGALVDWYCDRMRKVFKWVEVSRPIMNSRGTPLYHLVHATHDDTGHRIGKHILNMALREEARPGRRKST